MRVCVCVPCTWTVFFPRVVRILFFSGLFNLFKPLILFFVVIYDNLLCDLDELYTSLASKRHIAASVPAGWQKYGKDEKQHDFSRRFFW